MSTHRLAKRLAASHLFDADDMAVIDAALNAHADAPDSPPASESDNADTQATSVLDDAELILTAEFDRQDISDEPLDAIGVNNLESVVAAIEAIRATAHRGPLNIGQRGK